MRGLKRNPWLFGLGLLAIPVLFGGQALADINNDQAGSLIIFPKVIADGERDTVIKITNRSNMPANAHCYYTNALGSCALSGESCIDDGDCETGDSCDVVWQATNFDIFLTAQQPTFWRVSTGRFGALTQPACEIGEECACDVEAVSGALECPGFDAGAAGGINSIAIAGTGTDFFGELRCYQTQDDQTTPLNQDSLVGEAIIETIETGQISVYDAVHVSGGTGINNGDNDLLLDGSEYNSCPEQLLFASHGEGATAEIGGEEVSFSTELTLIPCTALYNFATPVTASVNIFVYDEFESRLSADGVPVTCFANDRLDDQNFGGIFAAGPGRQYLKTRIVVNDDDICLTGDNAGNTCDDNGDCPNFDTTPDGVELGCRPSPGVVGVAEEFYGDPNDPNAPEGHSAWSLTLEGQRASDVIVIADPSGN